MDIELITKIDELINIFDNSPEIKKLDKLKKELYQDQELKDLITKYQEYRDTSYSGDKVKIKKEIINNKLVNEYKKLEEQLYFLVLEINKRLKTLTEEKSCL